MAAHCTMSQIVRAFASFGGLRRSAEAVRRCHRPRRSLVPAGSGPRDSGQEKGWQQPRAGRGSPGGGSHGPRPVCTVPLGRPEEPSRPSSSARPHKARGKLWGGNGPPGTGQGWRPPAHPSPVLGAPETPGVPQCPWSSATLIVTDFFLRSGLKARRKGCEGLSPVTSARSGRDAFREPRGRARQTSQRLLQNQWYREGLHCQKCLTVQRSRFTALAARLSFN